MGQVLTRLDHGCKDTRQAQGKGGKCSVFMLLDSQAHACLSGELSETSTGLKLWSPTAPGATRPRYIIPQIIVQLLVKVVIYWHLQGTQCIVLLRARPPNVIT